MKRTITILCLIAFLCFTFSPDLKAHEVHGTNSQLDFNNDLVIDIQDLAIISLNYNIKSSENTYDSKYDVLKDGIIDLYDISMVSRAFGTTVSILPTGITLNKNMIYLTVGDSGEVILPTISPANATDITVTWSSSNSNVATVDNNGTVHGADAGEAVITASTSNGLTAVCTIRVNRNNAVLPAATYRIKLRDSGVNLDVSGGGNANKTNVQVWEVNSSSAQIWRLENIHDNLVRLWPLCAPDKTLDVFRGNNPSVAIGQNIDIYTDNDPPAQEWMLTKLYNGSHVLRLNALKDGAVRAEGSSSGSNVILGQYNHEDPLQQWIFEPYTYERNAWVYNTDGDGLNVRSGPSASDPRIGHFNEGQQITVIGDSINGWYQVRGVNSDNNQTITGYSSGDYITFKEPSPNPGFTIRTTAPAHNDYHYYSNQNVYYASGYGMPNCTAYAWGRAWEMTGTKLPSGFFLHDAKTWWGDNLSGKKFRYGSTPKPGSIAVWDGRSWNGWAGHVAIVEKVENGDVYISQSAWKSYEFKYNKLTTTDGFLGYIYLFEPN